MPGRWVPDRRWAGPAVGRAYKFLLDLRLDEGELGPEEAERRLRAWAADTL